MKRIISFASLLALVVAVSASAQTQQTYPSGTSVTPPSDPGTTQPGTTTPSTTPSTQTPSTQTPTPATTPTMTPEQQQQQQMEEQRRMEQERMQQQTAPQTTPSTTPSDENKTLPSTASPLPLIGLGGLLSLATAFALGRRKA